MNPYSVFYKNREMVASAELPHKASISPFFEGVDRIDLFYFPTIRLIPRVLFAHLAGMGLPTWLNDCDLHTINELGHEECVGDKLKYIHGRSEVMRGKQSISLVLLANLHFTRHMEVGEWLGHVPEIYKRFLGLDSNAKKEA